MKAALISLGSVSSQWTHHAMKKYFDSVDMIPLRELEVKLGAEGGVYWNGEALKTYDCVYLKGSFRYAQLLRAAATFLQGNCYMPLEPHAFTTVHNKLLTHIVLQKHHIPMPRTYITPNSEEAKLLLKNVHYPIIMKFPEGTQGKGVMIADSMASASSMLDALGALDQPFIIQEYIEGGEEDIRAFVVGDTVVASMKRVAQRGEARANIHAGGEGKLHHLTPEEQQIALQTAKVLGAHVCGVDLLQGPKGPLVIEANISPGLQGITSVTQIDVADKIAKFLHSEAAKFAGVHHKKEAQKIVHANDKNSELITELSFKGDRIVLPGVVTKMSGFTEGKNYSVRAENGKLCIEEFKVKRNG